jgi:nitrate reductase NapE component
VNYQEQPETNEQRAVGQGDAVSQVDTTEKSSEAKEPPTWLLAFCLFGIVAFAMMGWISMLVWLAWRLVDWLFF